MASSPFLNEVRTSIRVRGMSIRTEKTYIYWIRFFIRYNHCRHPTEMGAAEVVGFLGHLATERNVVVHTQRIALNALAYLYNQFLKQPLGDLEFKYASKPQRLPEVLMAAEVASILKEMTRDNQESIGPSIPGVLAKKYPSAYRQSAWMYLFPSSSISRHPVTGVLCRHHLHDSVPRKALKKP